MLYILEGDQEKAKTKLELLIKSLLEKRPNSEIFKHDSEDFEKTKLEEYIYGQGLFDSKYIIIFKDIFGEEEARDVFLGLVKPMAESSNIFFLIEKKILSADRKKLEKYANKIESSGILEKPKKRNANIFSITDALGVGGRKIAWVEYQKALKEGTDPQEVLNVLFWHLKTIKIAQSSTQKNSGMSPWVYSKAIQRGKTDFNLLRKIIRLYHERRNVEIEIEKILIEAQKMAK